MSRQQLRGRGRVLAVPRRHVLQRQRDGVCGVPGRELPRGRSEAMHGLWAGQVSGQRERPRVVRGVRGGWGVRRRDAGVALPRGRRAGPVRAVRASARGCRVGRLGVRVPLSGRDLPRRGRVRGVHGHGLPARGGAGGVHFIRGRQLRPGVHECDHARSKRRVDRRLRVVVRGRVCAVAAGLLDVPVLRVLARVSYFLVDRRGLSLMPSSDERVAGLAGLPGFGDLAWP